MDYASKTYTDIFGLPLYVSGKKDYSIICELLKIYDARNLEELWDIFLKDDDAFISTVGRSIGTFRGQIPHLAEIWADTRRKEEALAKREAKKDEDKRLAAEHKRVEMEPYNELNKIKHHPPLCVSNTDSPLPKSPPGSHGGPVSDTSRTVQEFLGGLMVKYCTPQENEIIPRDDDLTLPAPKEDKS